MKKTVACEKGTASRGEWEPGRKFWQRKITLEQPAEPVTGSKSGRSSARYRAKRVAKPVFVMRVVPRVNTVSSLSGEALFFYKFYKTDKVWLSQYFATETGGQYCGLQQDIEFAGNRLSYAGQSAEPLTVIFIFLV